MILQSFEERVRLEFLNNVSERERFDYWHVLPYAAKMTKTTRLGRNFQIQVLPSVQDYEQTLFENLEISPKINQKMTIKEIRETVPIPKTGTNKLKKGNFLCELNMVDEAGSDDDDESSYDIPDEDTIIVEKRLNWIPGENILEKMKKKDSFYLVKTIKEDGTATLKYKHYYSLLDSQEVSVYHEENNLAWVKV